MRSIFTIMWLAFALLPTTTIAASFDCKKSSTFVEKAICSDAQLSVLDEQLAAIYRPIANSLKADQKNWLTYIRNTCQDVECLKTAYEQRLKQLTTRDHINRAIDADASQSLTLKCDYSDYGSFQFENISIYQTKGEIGHTASTKSFHRGSTKPDDETFIIYPDQFAECIYPSGTQVRAKVGQALTRPYGMCGGDPEIFMSIWVNQRKIASRVWFAGHCIEDRELPEVSFKISGYKGTVIQKCHTARGKPAEEDLSAKIDSNKTTSEPLFVCVDFPDIENFLRDPIEYPSQPGRLLAVGEYSILRGKELPVCQAVVGNMILGPYSPEFSKQGNKKIAMPEWKNPSIQLPEDLRSSQEAIMDIDNDGMLDRVISSDFSTTYMHGSVLLIQPGDSLSGLHVSNDPMNSDSSRLLPCQLDSVQRKVKDCPPFSQKGDDANFTIAATNSQESVTFRARYTDLSPFTFKGENFIGVSSHSEDTLNYSAVLKLLPQQQVKPVCLIKRVVENY